ncbi:MAG: isoleucine--tRNA ligase [Simkaniaceae bacterium]|nr:isoleucine--tRNA ligase [Simkaniaceae bacterium]
MKTQVDRFSLQKETFAEREERIQKVWEKENTFIKSVEGREGREIFAAYDGPPFATGLPHYGHILAGAMKDVMLRYKTMAGYQVPRRFGWDCHGLPVENEIEKAQELAGAPSIEKFGIGKFNEECRSIVFRFTEEWKSTVNRMGRWVDFDHTYHTMDKTFMESVWWVFGSLWKKDLVYEGFKVMPFSAQLGTPLSNFEANLNYKDVTDPSIVVKFPLKDDPKTFLLVWTTTPWTLLSNLAAVVNPHIVYVKVKDKESGEKYILAKSRVKAHFKNREDIEVLQTMKGIALQGRPYSPPFGLFADQASPNAWHVLVDEFVGEEDGTGVVHAAPAFGEADFFVCQREEIEPICPVDQNGKFTSEVPEYAGMFVKDADKDIIKRLKAEHLIFHHGQVMHRYPFCWRSDTPLIYKTVNTWFVGVEKIKDRLIAANEEINWVPGHLKKGRFGKWLENARDWAISRNRYWGTPIPIWRAEDGTCIVVSSVQELEERTGEKITDLHRHFIDDLTFKENGKTFKRIPEVFDCWFESGSMPYAQNHFPFDNKEATLDAFPADFIAEGLDQTRGWFYTLHVLGVALFDKPAYKNVIVNGIVLAEDGNKMSKRLRNYPDPNEVFNKYGADSVRLYLMNSPVVEADDLRFSERGVELVLRQVLIPLWNAYVFFATYANIYGWQPSGFEKPEADIDRWILSKGQKLALDVSQGMDAYMLDRAVEPFVGYIDSLTNWYIRRSRPRFWSELASVDRDQAFQTLYQALMHVVKIAAPFVPFIADAIYRNLRHESDPESVHLCDFPMYDTAMRDEALEHEMSLAQTVVSLGHSLRKEQKLKVRQPLRRAYLISGEEGALEALSRQEDLIKEELNVKELSFEKDEAKFVKLLVKPNYRILGKKVGKLMNLAKGAIEKLEVEEQKRLMRGGTVTINLEGELFELTDEDVQVERQVREGVVALSDSGVTVTLETELDEELLMEGIAREVVNKINTMRRNQGFEVTDRISVTLQTTERVRACFDLYQEYITKEVLADEVHFTTCEGTGWDINGEQTLIQISQNT